MTLPPFHERNQILLEESRVLLDREEKYIGESRRPDGATFYALGSFQSVYLQQEIFGGIKKIKRRSQKYFISSLTNLLFIEKYFPQIISLFPLFWGGIKNDDTFDIIMEDYSQNKTRVVTDSVLDRKLLPQCLYHSVRDFDSLTSNFCSFNQNRDPELKLMDFDMIDWEDKYLKRRINIRTSLEKNPELLNPYLIHQ